jgi:transcriptional regulator with XRE-family HTH domain
MRATQNVDLMRAFAAEVKARRGELGFSQEELAHRSEVNRTFVAKVELAQNQPSLTVLHKLSDGLEMELPELIAKTLRRYHQLLKAKGSAIEASSPL